MRRGTLLVAAVPMLLVGCGEDPPAAPAEPKTTTVTVNFQLADYDTAFYECEGTGGYSDIGPGTSVTLRNGSGDVLGAESLGEGEPSDNGVQASYCDWTVKLEDVPADEDFYAVEVASRGEITSSREDLEADGWTFDVSLGEL